VTASTPDDTGRSGTEATALQTKIFLAAVLLVAVGVLARVVALSTELWLDEIWSLYATRELVSVGEVFTKYQSSANHLLYSLLFYAVGDHESRFLYRLPSLVAGTLTIPLVWLVARPAGRIGAAVAATLTATSYLMIHFSSEARGYALVVFFSVATLYAARRFLEGFRWSWASVFWLCACLGFLSHVMYALTFAAACTWLPVQLFATRRDLKGALLRSLQVLGVPLGFFSALYLVFLRHFWVDGGPEFSWPGILIKTLSYAGGGPASGLLASLAALLTAAVFLQAIARMRETDSLEWLFFATAILVAPALTLLVQQPDVMFVRYFLISIVFCYVAVGYWAESLFRQGRSRRLALGFAMLLFVVGNGVNVAHLLRYGRGAYAEGVRFMAENTPGEVVTFFSDHPVRNGMVVDYYGRFVEPHKAFRSVTEYSATERPPTWLILHRFDRPTDIRTSVQDLYGNTYALARYFPYFDLSGWHWFIYRLGDPEPPR